MATIRPLSPAAREAARVLGIQVRAGRRARRWTVQELATRAGVSDATMRKVEHGDASVALGTAFEAAALVGVTLFDEDPDRRRLKADHLVLLSNSRPARPAVDTDF